MPPTTWPPITWLWLCLSALAAGVMNSFAGGGTLLTFPTLLAIVKPVTANATSTVALVPGSVAGAWGYRREFGQVRRWAVLLAGPSLLGGWRVPTWWPICPRSRSRSWCPG